MVYLILDTETSNIPIPFEDCDPPYTKLEHYDFARLLQFSWCVVNYNCEVIKTRDYITSNEFKITNSHIHGITAETCKEKGIKIEDILKIFSEDLKDIRLLVGHNVNFDLNIIKAEAYRLSLQKPEFKELCDIIIANLEKIETFDTMILGQIKYKLQKYPRLTELHQLVFGVDFNGAHNALNDILATAKCFVKILFEADLKT